MLLKGHTRSANNNPQKHYSSLNRKQQQAYQNDKRELNQVKLLINHIYNITMNNFKIESHATALQDPKIYIGIWRPLMAILREHYNYIEIHMSCSYQISLYLFPLL
jgi:hypothetical protein